MQAPEKLGTEPPRDPAIPLPGMHRERTVIQKDTCISVYTAAPLTVASTRKRPKCPPTDTYEEDVARTTDCCSAIKRVKQRHCSDVDAPTDDHPK